MELNHHDIKLFIINIMCDLVNENIFLRLWSSDRIKSHLSGPATSLCVERKSGVIMAFGFSKVSNNDDHEDLEYDHESDKDS